MKNKVRFKIGDRVQRICSDYTSNLADVMVVRSYEIRGDGTVCYFGDNERGFGDHFGDLGAHGEWLRLVNDKKKAIILNK